MKGIEKETENDKKLIQEANKASCIDYFKVRELINKADSEDTKDYLKSRANYLYHLEEYHAGLL